MELCANGNINLKQKKVHKSDLESAPAYPFS